MPLPDVNVLIYAHREDPPEHERYAAWLRAVTESDEPFAVAEVVLASVIRIVTTPKMSSWAESSTRDVMTGRYEGSTPAKGFRTVRRRSITCPVCRSSEYNVSHSASSADAAIKPSNML